MTDLRIAARGAFVLPLDTVTQTTAILGNRGSGKTNTAGVIVEELLGQNQQVVIVDPLDVWWGLKSSKDGARPGLAITVLGGYHGDLPLLDTDGSIVADAIVEYGASVILSLRHLSKNGQRRFVTAFAERIYDRKGEAGRATPVLVVIDECDAFVPQKVKPGTEVMVGAIDDLVRRGRASGIGVILISQRAAVVNKDVLTQLELLVAHRHTSPQDRKALDEWIQAHDTEDRRDEFLKNLASLPQGTAYFWSPGWLDVFRSVKVRARNTFDSSATPKVGETRIEPRRLAEVDLEGFRVKLEATVKAQKEKDPAELRKQIRVLEQSLAVALAAAAAVGRASSNGRHEELEEIRLIFSNLRDGWARKDLAAVSQQVRDFERASMELKEALETPREWVTDLRDALERRPVLDLAAAMEAARDMAGRAVALLEAIRDGKPNPLVRQGDRLEGEGTMNALPVLKPGEALRQSSVPTKQLEILDALAWLESIGNVTPSRAAVAFVAGQAGTPEGFKKNLGILKKDGLVSPEGNVLRLLGRGRALARTMEAPSEADLHRDVIAKVGETRGRILKVLLAHRGAPLPADEVARLAGQDGTPEGFKKNVGQLRGLGLVAGTGRFFGAADFLFLDRRG